MNTTLRTVFLLVGSLAVVVGVATLVSTAIRFRRPSREAILRFAMRETTKGPWYVVETFHPGEKPSWIIVGEGMVGDDGRLVAPTVASGIASKADADYIVLLRALGPGSVDETSHGITRESS